MRASRSIAGRRRGCENFRYCFGFQLMCRRSIAGFRPTDAGPPPRRHCGVRWQGKGSPVPGNKLATYRSKRDFRQTAEPRGTLAVAKSKRLRFVIKKHAARQLHYDLRLEFDGVFKSWAVTRGPSLDPADKRLAVEVEDHPLDYGDFEGTIPKGEYGGGAVQLWDRGYWSPEGGRSPQEAFDSGDLKFTLDGERLHGSWVLVRMRADRYGGKRTNWLLIKHRDAGARPGDADELLKEDRSVASGRTMQQIAGGTGKRPNPFMPATPKAARADAVWSTQPATAKPTQPAAKSTPRAPPVMVA